MAQLDPSTLEDHPAGTTNLGGIINDNWHKLNKLFDPDLDPGDPLYGLIALALRGQGGGITTLVYAATVDLDFSLKEIQLLELAGDVTFTFSSLAVSRNVRLLIKCDGTGRAITWPAGVNWVATATTTIDANAYLIVELISASTTDTEVWASVGGGSGGGGGAPAGMSYKFNTATSGDPGSGKLLLNNATVASATALEISETDDDGNAVAAVLATWDDSTSTIRGTLTILAESNPAIFAVFQITGTLTDNGGYDTFSLTHVSSAGTFTADMPVRAVFARTGDAGATGAAGADGADGAAGADGASASTGLILAFATGNFLP